VDRAGYDDRVYDAVLVEPARMAEADVILMMMYGSLSALVGAYFGFSGGAVKK
jgi:hypothetical protein